MSDRNVPTCRNVVYYVSVALTLISLVVSFIEEGGKFLSLHGLQ